MSDWAFLSLKSRMCGRGYNLRAGRSRRVFVGVLFEGGNKSGEGTIRGNTVFQYIVYNSINVACTSSAQKVSEDWQLTLRPTLYLCS